MTQVAGTTPGIVQLRASKTAGNVPSGLADGELGIQQADHLAYYLDAAGNLCAFALNLATKAPTLSGGAYTTTTMDALKVLAVTTGASNAVITLVSAAAAGDGAVQQITKADGGAGIVQVSDNTSGTFNAASAWLFTKGDVIFLRSDGTAWSVFRFKVAPVRLSLLASASVTVPPLLTSADVQLFQGGAGGNSGARQATTAARTGGVPGSGGKAMARRINAADLPAPGTAIPVTVGAGGAGGAAVTTDGTNGPGGSSGGTTSFGTYLDTSPVPASGTSSALALSLQWGYAGPGQMAGSGGAGAGAAANSTTAIAGNGGVVGGEAAYSGLTAAQAGTGAGGTTSGTAPTAGAVPPGRPSPGGSGGGGGAYISGQAGQAGAAGGPFGGGGGGGAASDNGFASGAGGNGGPGGARITWNFGE